MSGKKKYYILTDTAETDFLDAKRWSISRWGKAQTKQYFIDLNKGAEYIAQNYLSIATKYELSGGTGLGIYAVREHYIVYIPIKKDFIIIIALVRQTRDVPTILSKNAYLIRRELEQVKDKLLKSKVFNLH